MATTGPIQPIPGSEQDTIDLAIASMEERLKKKLRGNRRGVLLADRYGVFVVTVAFVFVGLMFILFGASLTGVAQNIAVNNHH